MFRSRKHIRHIAAYVLLVWLFALGAGIANACLLETEARPQAGAGASGGHGHAWAHEHHGRAADGHGPPAPHGSKSPCAKFCDEPSVGAQSVKQQIDPFHAVWLGPVPSGSMIVVHSTPAHGAQAVDPERWRAAIPIPIAFLRLTL